MRSASVGLVPTPEAGRRRSLKPLRRNHRRMRAFRMQAFRMQAFRTQSLRT
jgi:hypothetical protein